MKTLRVAVLLFILAFAAAATYVPQWQAGRWAAPLAVDVYPINGDGSAAVDAYIAQVQSETYAPIAEFMAREAQRYGIKLTQPIKIAVQPPLRTQPPAPPARQQPLKVMWWSLKLRFWAYKHARAASIVTPRVRMFVLYYVGVEGKALQHSLGVKEGLIGVVHAYAQPDQDAQNNVVIAHELLHTVGARDKYAPEDNRPLFPDGFADATREPLYPQVEAEIMAGRVALSEDRAVTPGSLARCVIGRATSREIRWTQP